jgi:hypothetical protein
MSALAGGGCIDDAQALRSGGTQRVLGFALKAASTCGTFLRSFRWGHIRQVDRMTRGLLARGWAAGAGPGAEPLTIDLDSTICETYGLHKEGGSDFTYTHTRGYHPLLAVAAGRGDVLHARLRGGSANTMRGAGSFLAETIERVRSARASGELTIRADAGFYAHAVVAAARKRKDLHPVKDEPDAQPVRLIVRRVRPTPGSQLALFAMYDYHACITDRDGDTLALGADHRRHAEIENAIRDLKYGVGLNHLPSGRFAANGASLAVQVVAHNLARWTARIGLDSGS